MIGLTIDPGKSTGVCLWQAGFIGFDVIQRWQFTGGALGLHEWLNTHIDYFIQGFEVRHDGIRYTIDHLVVERFTPRNNPNFALTRDAVEPLVCEGVLIAHNLGPFIKWAEPSQQYFMGDSRLPQPEKLKLARGFLKLHELLPTGKELAAPDADDAVSATLHSIAYLRRIRHAPTLVQLFDN